MITLSLSPIGSRLNPLGPADARQMYMRGRLSSYGTFAMGGGAQISRGIPANRNSQMRLAYYRLTRLPPSAAARSSLGLFVVAFEGRAGANGVRVEFYVKSQFQENLIIFLAPRRSLQLPMDHSNVRRLCKSAPPEIRHVEHGRGEPPRVDWSIFTEYRNRRQEPSASARCTCAWAPVSNYAAKFGRGSQAGRLLRKIAPPPRYISILWPRRPPPTSLGTGREVGIYAHRRR